MKYLLGCLLLSSLTSWGISWTSVVTQPPSVTVTEGDTVHIHCCWNLNMTQVKVNWLKDSTQIVDDLNHNCIIVNNRPCLKSVQTAACNCSTMIISNVTRNDSGTYFCKITIEIPHFFQSVGNGTNLTVTSIDDTNNDTTVSVSELPLQMSTSIMVLLLLLTTVVCLYRVQKRHQERPLRLIHEVPHYEEEELKMEELGEAANQSSTSSSRSSTQWCQVQVYESIDYLAKPTQGNG